MDSRVKLQPIEQLRAYAGESFGRPVFPIGDQMDADEELKLRLSGVGVRGHHNQFSDKSRVEVPPESVDLLSLLDKHDFLIALVE